MESKWRYNSETITKVSEQQASCGWDTWEEKGEVFLISFFYTFYKTDFIYLFLERGEERRKEEKHQCVVTSHMPPTGDLAHNPGMCPQPRRVL